MGGKSTERPIHGVIPLVVSHSSLGSLTGLTEPSIGALRRYCLATVVIRSHSCTHTVIASRSDEERRQKLQHPLGPVAGLPAPRLASVPPSLRYRDLKSVSSTHLLGASPAGVGGHVGPASTLSHRHIVAKKRAWPRAFAPWSRRSHGSVLRLLAQHLHHGPTCAPLSSSLFICPGVCGPLIGGFISRQRRSQPS